MTDFTIDLSKSVFYKTLDYDDNINTINDKCYEISNAYGKTFGKDIEKQLNQQCEHIIKQKKHKLNYTNCYMKKPSRPVIWNQVPHFFPDLLKQYKDPEKAYKLCCQRAENSSFPEEALNHCLLDFMAINFTPPLEGQRPVPFQRKPVTN